MSVRKGDRAEGKLQVLNKARELKKYSLTIVKNDKHFPKSTRWLYAYPIVNEVRAACTCIRHANSVYVTNDEDYKYRHLEQATPKTQKAIRKRAQRRNLLYATKNVEIL